jgi:hypothetical protein
MFHKVSPEWYCMIPEPSFLVAIQVFSFTQGILPEIGALGNGKFSCRRGRYEYEKTGHVVAVGQTGRRAAIFAGGEESWYFHSLAGGLVCGTRELFCC